MKYKVGDVIKLRDDLEIYKYDVWLRIKGKPLTITETNCGKVYHQGKFISEGITIKSEEGLHYFADDEMIEGLWEECKSTEQVSKSEGKCKLIDILNKIANGELKEGTKVKFRGREYEYKSIDDDDSKDLFDSDDNTILDSYFITVVSDEVEIIEPPCEHEWENYETHRIGEGLINKGRRCKKCGLEEVTEERNVEADKTIEPTDNTKIEELDKEEMLCLTLQCAIAVLTDKLNEVIRKINKE